MIRQKAKAGFLVAGRRYKTYTYVNVNECDYHILRLQHARIYCGKISIQ